MIDTLLLPHYQRWLSPILNKLSLNRRVTPDKITGAAITLGLFSALALSFKLNLIAFILLIFSGLCDILDGALARAQNTQNQWGTVLDIMGDRIVECAIIIGLYAYAPDTRALLCLLMLISNLICLSSFFVVGILTPNLSQKSFHYSKGLIERFECFLLFFVMIVFPNAFLVVSLIYILMVVATAIIRLYQFYKNIQHYA